MSDTGNLQAPVEPTPLASLRKTNNAKRFAAWRLSLLMAGALIGGVAVGAGGFALAQAAPVWGHGPRLEHIQRFVLRALDSVGATTTQEAKIHDIIAAGSADIGKDPAEHEALRTHVLDLLRAPTVDRAAVEQLRAAQIASLDAKSRRIVEAVLDMAAQLTPEQRGKLADRAASMTRRGPMGGGWGAAHGSMEGGRHSVDGGRDPADEPDYGPDGGPDKG